MLTKNNFPFSHLFLCYQTQKKYEKLFLQKVFIKTKRRRSSSSTSRSRRRSSAINKETTVVVDKEDTVKADQEETTMVNEQDTAVTDKREYNEVRCVLVRSTFTGQKYSKQPEKASTCRNRPE